MKKRTLILSLVFILVLSMTQHADAKDKKTQEKVEESFAEQTLVGDEGTHIEVDTSRAEEIIAEIMSNSADVEKEISTKSMIPVPPLYDFVYPEHYFQDNPIWANVKIKGSEKTLAQRGCAITSFAMMLTLQHDENETPVTVNSAVGNINFNWTSAASHYGMTCFYTWPTKSQAYSMVIEQVTDNDRPVIIGLKKGSGYHFVIANGYLINTLTGEQTIYIEDPEGDFNYTTLKQYEDAGWSYGVLSSYYN